MYAHQVIEDCQNIDISKSKVDSISIYAKITSNLCNQIKISMHFNIGNGDELYELFKRDDGKILFMDKLATNIRLPYKKCWFDYDVPCSRENTDPKEVSTKRGLLVFEIYNDIFDYYLFAYSNYYKQWMAPIIHYFISIDKLISDHKIINEISNFVNIPKKNIIDNLKKNICPFPLIDFNFHESLKKLVNEDTYDLSILNSFLQLLSCKNITTERHEAPERLNKSRAKKGKGPLFTYHTLKLMPLSQKAKNKPGDPTGDHYRLHLCRGHFKRYTEDKPLFGRLTGLYWWQPHLRGQDSSGFVDKDYEVVVK